MTHQPASDLPRKFTPAQRDRARHFDCEGVPLHSFGRRVARVGSYLFSGVTPIAAGRDNLDVVRAIVVDVASPGQRDLQQALHIAHSLGREGIVSHLSARGVRAECRGTRPLYTRVGGDGDDIAESHSIISAPRDFTRVVLMSTGTRHPSLAQRVEIPLENLFLLGVGLADYAAVESLLEAGLYSPNSREGEWHSVSLATFLGEMEVVHLLHTRGAHINFSSKRCRPAIHHAVRNHDAGALMTLLELGADPNLQDPLAAGQTPLHVAANRVSEEPVDLLIVEILLAAGARKDVRWRSSESAVRPDRGARPFDLVGKGCPRLRALLAP